MADINPELERLIEQMNEEFGRLGYVTAETRRAFEQLQAEVAKQEKAMSNASNSLKSLAAAGMAAGTAMYQGKKGAAAFNDSLDQMSKAAEYAGAALTLLIPGGPIIKGLVAGITMATSAYIKYNKAANEMADQLYKGYSDLQKIGGAAADGMSGLFADTQKLGVSMQELDGYIALIGKNSKDLALFAGSVSQGRKRFAEIGESMKPFREGLLAAGIDMEEQRDATMGYLRMQSRLGLTQEQTNEQLARSAHAYILEQDALTKITGMSRKEAEDAREEIRSQERFAAKQLELRMQGREQEAKELENTYLFLRSQNKEAAQGFADLSTGFITTDAALKAFRSTNGEALRVSEQLSAGQLKAANAVQRYTEATSETVNRFGTTMGKVGTYNQTFGDLSGDLRLQAMSRQQIADQMAKIEKDQAERGLKGGKAADDLAANQGKLINAQIDANTAMKDFVFKGIGPAQSEMIKLAKATEKAGTTLDELTPGGKKTTVEAVGETTETIGALGAGVAGGLKGAALGAFLGPIGSAVGALIGSAAGVYLGGNIGKKVGEVGAQAAGLPGRADGSLGKTGKLIEDFGTGTPMMLHGREGVITEEQLDKLIATAKFQGSKESTKNAAVVSTRLNKDIDLPTAIPADRGATPGRPTDNQDLFNQIIRDVKLQSLTRDMRTTLTKTNDQLDQLMKLQVENVNLTEDNQDQLIDYNKLYETFTTKEKLLTEADFSNYKLYVSVKKQIQNQILDDLRKQSDLADEQTKVGAKPTTATAPTTAPAAASVPGQVVSGSGQPVMSGTGQPVRSGTGVDLTDYLKKTALIESGGKASAKAKTSSASGMFQFTEGTWKQMVKQMGKDYSLEDRFDPKKATEVAAFFTRQQQQQLEKATGRVSSEADLYMAHFLGAGGASKFLNAMQANPNAPASEGASEAQIKANASIFLDKDGKIRTLQQVYDLMSSKIGKAETQLASGRVTEDVQNIQAAGGGVFSGPMTGYPATLHGTEAVIPLKDGAVPVTLPHEFVALMSKYQSISDLAGNKNNLVEIQSNFSQTFSEELEKLKTQAIEAAGVNSSNLMETFKQMKDELRQQGEANRQLFESMLRGDDNTATVKLLADLVKEQRTANDISSKILKTNF